MFKTNLFTFAQYLVVGDKGRGDGHWEILEIKNKVIYLNGLPFSYH